MLWFICFFNYADRQAIFSVFKILKAEYGFSEEQLGWIGAAFGIVYGVVAPLGGQVGDQWRRKTVILGGLYVWSLITGFTALCSRFWHFVLVRGAEGLGETFYFPASNSLISDYHTRRTRSRALAIHQSSVYFGTIGGGVLAGWMGQRLGWWSPFLLLGSLGIILGLILSLFIREPERDEAERAEQQDLDPNTPGMVRQPFFDYFRQLVQSPAILLLLAFGCANGVALVFLSWMPKFLSDKFELNLAAAGFGATFYTQIASMFGVIAGGFLADWWYRRTKAGRIAVQIIGSLVGAPFIFFCGDTLDIWVLVAAMTCFGFCKGLYDSNIWASMFEFVHPSRRGTTVGIGNFIGWSAAAPVPILVGRSVDRGWATMSQAIASTAILYVIVGVLLMGAAIWVQLRRTPAAY